MPAEINTAAISFNTVAVHGRKMEYNTLQNIPALARSYGIKHLRGKFQGSMAVVASAGPSLDGMIETLKKYQGQYILIAADRALKPLLEAGLIPHIVCTADMDQMLLSLYEGFEIPHGVALLYDRDCFFGVPAGWEGPLITYDSYYDTPMWESVFTGKYGFMSKNFTVSHTAMYAAHELGCSPIILAGVDFAYPDKDKQHHASGVVDNPLEVREKQVATWVDIPGNVLPTVHTTEVFWNCVPTMTAGIHERRMAVYNASPIGAKIEGAPYKPIAECMELSCKEFGGSLSIADYLMDAKREFDLPLFDAHSRDVITRMDKLLFVATEGIDILKKMKTIGLRDQSTFWMWMTKLKEAIVIQQKIREDVMMVALLSRCMAFVSFHVKRLNEQMKDIPLEDKRRGAADAEKLAIYFHVAGEGCKLFISRLQAVRQELGLSVIETAWKMPAELSKVD